MLVTAVSETTFVSYFRIGHRYVIPVNSIVSSCNETSSLCHLYLTWLPHLLSLNAHIQEFFYTLPYIFEVVSSLGCIGSNCAVFNKLQVYSFFFYPVMITYNFSYIAQLVDKCLLHRMLRVLLM
jgi:hypothetical protein